MNEGKVNNMSMPGLAILLFSCKKTRPALDKGDKGDNGIKFNTGTKDFINHVTQCIEQRLFGLEFLNLYPES